MLEASLSADRLLGLPVLRTLRRRPIRLVISGTLLVGALAYYGGNVMFGAGYMGTFGDFHQLFTLYGSLFWRGVPVYAGSL